MLTLLQVFVAFADLGLLEGRRTKLAGQRAAQA